MRCKMLDEAPSDLPGPFTGFTRPLRGYEKSGQRLPTYLVKSRVEKPIDHDEIELYRLPTD